MREAWLFLGTPAAQAEANAVKGDMQSHYDSDASRLEHPWKLTADDGHNLCKNNKRLVYRITAVFSAMDAVALTQEMHWREQLRALPCTKKRLA